MEIAVTGINREKLAKVLALLSSPVDAEALAATRMATKLLAEAGMRPEQLVDGIPKTMTPVIPSRSPWPWPSPADNPRPRHPKPAPPPSFRDLGPAAARRVLDDLLATPLLPKHAMFVRAIRERLRVESHKGLTTAEVRKLNRLWRAMREMAAAFAESAGAA
jgi:hypothetical protein